MKRVLLTGFSPFGDDTLNPALELINSISGKNKHATERTFSIKTMELPVVFGKAIKLLEMKIIAEKPDLILSFGQAGGRMGLSIERLGININDARIADNEGNKPSDQLIADKGPAAYFTNIEARKTYDALKKQNIPTIISYSAGTFVCNNLIYGAMHFLTREQLVNKTKFGFIHIPYLPIQVASKTKLFPSMGLSLIEKAVPIIVKTNL